MSFIFFSVPLPLLRLHTVMHDNMRPEPQLWHHSLSEELIYVYILIHAIYLFVVLLKLIENCFKL